MQCLVELELPHLYHSVARNSPKRPLLTEKWGSFQVSAFVAPHIVNAHGTYTVPPKYFSALPERGGINLVQSSALTAFSLRVGAFVLGLLLRRSLPVECCAL